MPGKKKMPTIEELEAMVDRGEDISAYFKKSTMKPGFKGPIKAVNSTEASES